jgi:ferredoxin-thioredoxin reductase catalytic subunit
MVMNYVDIPDSGSYSLDSIPQQALSWAEKNCPSYITNDAVQKHGEYYYRFYFSREQDRMWFALRWL